MVKRGTDQHIIKTHQNPQNMRKQSKYNSFRQTQAGIAQSVEHFTRNEGVIYAKNLIKLMVLGIYKKNYHNKLP